VSQHYVFIILYTIVYIRSGRELLTISCEVLIKKVPTFIQAAAFVYFDVHYLLLLEHIIY